MIGTSNANVRHRNSGGTRFLYLDSVAISGAIAIVMILSPASGAVIQPAFHGSTTTIGFTEYSGCHAKNSVLHKPTFSLRSGVGHFGGGGSVVSCPGQLGHVASGLAGQEMGSVATIPVSLATGSNNITVAMTIAATMGGAVTFPNTANPCPATTSSYYVNSTYFTNVTEGFCEVLAETQIYGVAEIYDGTTNTWIPPTGGSASAFYPFESFEWKYNLTYIDYGCYDYNYANPICYSSNGSSETGSTSFTQSLSTTGDAWFNDTAGVHSDSYVVLITVVGYMLADITGYDGLSAKVAMNAGTLGNHWSLNSISIT